MSYLVEFWEVEDVFNKPLTKRGKVWVNPMTVVCVRAPICPHVVTEINFERGSVYVKGGPADVAASLNVAIQPPNPYGAGGGGGTSCRYIEKTANGGRGG